MLNTNNQAGLSWSCVSYVQLVHINTKIVSSNPAHDHGEVYSLQHYVLKFVSDFGRSVVFSGYFGLLHQ